MMLEVRDLHADYNGIIALHGVDLDVDDGEAVALVGSNGAGKSTLLGAICGLHRPVRGSIIFDGSQLSRLPAHRIAPLGIALVPEGRRLFGKLTVERNLLLGAYHQRDTRLRHEDLDYVLALLPALKGRLHDRAAALSGGQQQMVALGRALMSRPRLLMLDEPSLGIAPNVTERLFDALCTVRDRGTAILIIEQNLRLALGFATRAYVLQTGRVKLSGAADDLRESDDVRRAYLGI
jgi:branched-chain amino acid transport system ATP-binding protein